MSVPVTTWRTLAPLPVITVAALLFTLLLLLVRLRWAPLESADHNAATWLNSLIVAARAVVAFNCSYGYLAIVLLLPGPG